MANVPLKSIKFPGLPDTYIIPQVDNTLTQQGRPADAKKTGDEITSIKQDLSELNTAIGSPTLLEWAHTSGYYVHTNTTINPSSPYTTSSGWNGKCLFMECSPGDEFIVSLLGTSTNLRPWCFYSSTGVIISKGDANNQYVNYKVVAPENAAYVGFNSINTDAYGTIYTGEYVFDQIKNELEAEIADVETIVDSIVDTIGSSSEMTWDKTDSYYISTASTIDPESPYTYNGSYYGKCSFLECSAGDVFVVSLVGGNNFRPYAFVSVDGTIIEKGDNKTYINERIIAPENSAYVAFNLTGRGVEGSVTIGETIFQRYDAEIDDVYDLVKSTYNGKKCVAFGTSLTYRELGYRPYLAELLGMTIDNQGVGSAYWRDWSQSSANILYNVQNYEGYADKDVCIIEGCVNDWAGNRALGTYKDTGTDTVCGCLYNMISHVYTQNPNIQIFVILDHFGRVNGSTDTSSSAVNSNNLTQYDFYEECAKLCNFYGIPCIKEYEISSIGIFGTEYLYDNIHLNALGGQQSAMVIAEAMNKIPSKKQS